MVKNEAPSIVPTLETYMGNPEVAFFVFDTGSDDNTIALAENLFKERGVTHFAIAQEPFIDFATSRNRALRLAEEQFPQAQFMLMPDCEWYLTGLDTLVEFCKKEKRAFIPAYLVDINAGCEFTTPRLIRAHMNVCFEGVVHEIIGTTGLRVPKEVRFDMKSTSYGAEKSRKRWERDVQLLLKEHEKRPTDSRTLFYLAQTYHCLGDLVNAQIYYELRTKNQGWDEENFMALYRLAQVLEERSKQEKNEQLWYYAQDCYLKAYGMRPERAETLIRLAQHYLAEDDFSLSYLFAKHAREIPYPIKETLFVEKELYDYTVHDILGIVCWYIKQYKLGKEEVIKALEAKGELPHLLQNLACYMGLETNANVPA